MGAPPPPAVLEAFLAPTSTIVRRVEICENDGATPWKPHLWDRLVSGSVSADYSRDERRAVELVLDNYDGALDHAPSNLWYDKVFKVFYGVQVGQLERSPAILIMEEYGLPGQAVALKAMLNAQGFTRVRINTTASLYSQIEPYDIVVSISIDYTRKLALLQAAYNAGKGVLTFHLTPTAAQLPDIISAAASATVAAPAGGAISRNTAVAHPMNSGWDSWASAAGKTIRRITAAASGAAYVGHYSDPANGTSYGVIARGGGGGARWAHFQHAQFDPAQLTSPEHLSAAVGQAARWLDTFEPISYWECQIGEFLVDMLKENETGDLIAVTGRDYAKRAMLSKFVNATGYAKGTNVGAIIRGIAANAGISKFNLPIVTAVLTRDIVYERGTERWKAMKEIADSASYELFFDADGFLVMRPYADPLLTPPSLELTRGAGGNLVSAATAATDARLFNHVVVTGESSDANVPPVAAEARNTLASSPSSIQRIGDRVVEHTSSLVTTAAQAQELANSYLRVSSLEEFEMDFSSILLPWIEPGEIIEIEQWRDNQYQPTRYLLSSLSLPLDLGPMSGNGKRVTVVL